MPLPSPVCTVNALSTPQDVAAGATNVLIALASTAGANYWSIQCTATDEVNATSAINATLVVNQGAKTATFTAPAALGSAVIFTSIVGVNGLGLDANSTLQPSFTTTFKVNVKAANALRVLANSETFEQSAASGWTAVLNPAIRAAGGGGGGLTITGTGVAHVTGGAIDGAAKIGTANQLFVTNAGGTDTVFVTVTGDTTIAAGVSTTASINGSTVPVGGSLVTGNVLQVNGPASLSYGAVNLAGGGGYVAGILPFTNGGTGLGAVGSNGQVLTVVSGAPAWASAGGITWANDLVGSNSSQQWVAAISGQGGIGGTVNVGDGTHTTILRGVTSLQASPPPLSMLGSQGFSAPASAGSTGGNMSVQSGQGGSGQGTNVTGGPGGILFLSAGAGGGALGTAANANGGPIYISGGAAGTGGSGGAGATGSVFLRSGSLTVAFVSATTGGVGFGIGSTPGTDPTLTSGTGVPATTQPNGSLFMRTDGTSSTGLYVREAGAWSALGGGGSTVTWASDLAGSTNSNQWVAAISGSAGGGGNITVNASNFAWAVGQASPGLSQTIQANASAPANLTIAPQAPGASATNATNGTPGSLVVNFAAIVNGGTTPALSLRTAGTEYAQLTSFLPGLSYPGLYSATNNLGILAASGFVLVRAAAGPVGLSASTTVLMQDTSNNTWFTFTPSASASMQFAQGATAPTVNQAQQANGSNPANLVIAPQAPGAGAASTATGTPGSFVTNVAVPVSTGLEAGLRFQRNGSLYGSIQAYDGFASTTAAMYIGPGIVPSSTNYTIAATSSLLVLNAPTGNSIFLRTGGSQTSPGFGINASGLQFGSETFALGGGVGVIGIANRTTAPTSNPSGGIVGYSDSGALTVRGSGGSIDGLTGVGYGTINTQLMTRTQRNAAVRTAANTGFTIDTIPLPTSGTAVALSCWLKGRETTGSAPSTEKIAFLWKNSGGTLTQKSLIYGGTGTGAGTAPFCEWTTSASTTPFLSTSASGTNVTLTLTTYTTNQTDWEVYTTMDYV